MGFEFNADEIFRIGEQIEINGEKFYRAAAVTTTDVKFKGLLADLARQEAIHQSRFRLMRKNLTEEMRRSMVFDPNDESAAYLQATASTHVFSGEMSPGKLLKGAKSPREILGRALQFEKDSILFYQAMKDFVPENAGRDQIDWLVREEMTHVLQLNEMMKQY